MAVQSSFYFTDGATRTFPSTKHIATKQHCAVYLKRVSDSVWEIASTTAFSLVNNSIVFTVAPVMLTYSSVEIRVADEVNELTVSPSDIALVAGSITNVNIVAMNLSPITVLVPHVAAIDTVSLYINNVNSVAADLTNIDAIVADLTNIDAVASDLAAIDDVHTNMASVVGAVTQAEIATTQAGIATTQAGIATTQASNAGASAASALAYLDLFKGQYYGSLATDPTLDPLGNAMGIGDLYWNSAVGELRIFNGTVWTVATATGANVSNIPSGNIAATTVQGALDELDTEKAALASPTFTGTPTAPTAAAGTNTTQLATTGYVKTEIPNALNATGSAPIYACRAWVNFNGTGTVAIRASGNVSSITDNGTGNYTVNFTTAMQDANYAFPSTASFAADGALITLVSAQTTSLGVTTDYASSTTGTTTPLDSTYVNISIIR
jgi:hypothetical protein